MVSRVSLIDNLKKADLLKEKCLSPQNVNNPDVWAIQQQLLNLYAEVLILDLEFALDKKVEQDLWNYCFKNYIASLQNFARDKKSANGLFHAKLTWFLECASGFYLSLLQEICTVFNLDLPFKRSDALFGVARQSDLMGKVNMPKRNSCYYISQHCLVHLGDIARYRNQMVQAESFYREAVALGPSSGHPYNQLALLEASRGDRLSIVFYYVRSIAVAHHFPAAITNLNNILQKHISSTKDEMREGGKVSASEYESLFLRLHAVLVVGLDLSLARPLLSSLSPALTPLIATQDFSSWKLLQMAVISIFVYNHVEEKKSEVQQIMAEFLTGFLNALLLPVYTVSSDCVASYFGLPAIKTLVSWMKCEPSVIERLNKQSLWKGMCKLLNELRTNQLGVAPPTHMNDALPEDYDLRGFIPLDQVTNSLNFQEEDLNPEVELKLRSFRLIKLGEWLANTPSKPIYISDSGLFEVIPVTLTAISSQYQTQVVTPNQDFARLKTSQNVALQSILRLSNGLGEGDHARWDQTDVQVSNPARWWPPPRPLEETSWTTPDISNEGGGMYSLFSGSVNIQPLTSNLTSTGSALKHQSLWSGPGPSPLERLLEQQKTQRIPQLDT